MCILSFPKWAHGWASKFWGGPGPPWPTYSYVADWNPHRLHPEPFPPKENHNVGLLRFDDDHDHICYRFAQVQIFGGKSNVFKSLQAL
jgi:hypothetical protein